MAVHLVRPEHEALYQEFADLLKKHTEKLPPLEILAIAANLVGKLIAFQDQRTVTPERAMKIVGENIERGNLEARAEIMGAPAGHA